MNIFKIVSILQNWDFFKFLDFFQAFSSKN